MYIMDNGKICLDYAVIKMAESDAFSSFFVVVVSVVLGILADCWGNIVRTRHTLLTLNWKIIYGGHFGGYKNQIKVKMAQVYNGGVGSSPSVYSKMAATYKKYTRHRFAHPDYGHE